MVAHDEKFKGVEIGRYADYEVLSKDLKKYVGENVFFFCIGTDRSTGDSFAPLIGTKLVENGYNNVLGTLSDPVHAMNLDEKIKLIPKDRIVIAIDACLGKQVNIGTLSLRKGYMNPGSGVGKTLTKVGDFAVNGVVNISAKDNNILNFQVLQGTRLNTVYKMVNMFVEAVKSAYPIQSILREVKEG